MCYYSVTFFFFFKHKTAYEMRISDWSSDVCSSDLRDFVSRVAESDRPKLQPIEFAAWREWALNQANRLDPTRNERLFDLSISNTELWSAFKKIGRATRRERVCEYVVIAVVGGYLKKKEKKQESSTRRYTTNK